MAYDPIVLSLPIADRGRSHDFYRAALGLETIGPLGDDGIPEPLQFVVNAGMRVMLIPGGGFGWIVGGREVATAGTHECLLAITAATDGEVDAVVHRAIAAGATMVSAAGAQPWGYAGAFADPDGHIWMVRTDPDLPTA